MKPMIYKSTKNIEILFQGSYNNFDFIIVSYGPHPCAYVKIPADHKYYKTCYDDIDVDVHGGLTFGDNLLHINIGNPDDYYLGWDYAHFGDYSGHDIIFQVEKDLNKKWTTEEIFEEVKSVIDQLIKN